MSKNLLHDANADPMVIGKVSLSEIASLLQPNGYTDALHGLKKAWANSDYSKAFYTNHKSLDNGCDWYWDFFEYSFKPMTNTYSVHAMPKGMTIVSISITKELVHDFNVDGYKPPMSTMDILKLLTIQSLGLPFNPPGSPTPPPMIVEVCMQSSPMPEVQGNTLWIHPQRSKGTRWAEMIGEGYTYQYRCHCCHREWELPEPLVQKLQLQFPSSPNIVNIFLDKYGSQVSTGLFKEWVTYLTNAPDYYED